MSIGADRPIRAAARGGFTLAELLVSVSIIVGLIGLLLPAVAAVRTEARRVSCLSNLHQISVALTSYTHAHGGRLPAARYMPSPFVSIYADPPMPEVLSRYSGAGLGHALYHCPHDAGYVHGLCGTSYFYLPLFAATRIEDEPAIEYAAWSADQIPLSGDFDNGLFLTSRGELEVPPFHDRRNLAFADGHVGTLDADGHITYRDLD